MEAAEIQLTVPSLTMGGVYYCAAYNGFPTQPQRSDGASLLVIEPVSGIDIMTDKDGEDFTIGEALNLTCSAQRGTSISVSWLHNDTVVEESSELYQLKDNGKVLYIPSLLYDHEGWYQCNASNQLSPNRTFSALSNILQVNVLEPSAGDYSTQWLMVGILLPVTIVVVGLILIYRKKNVSVKICHKKSSSTGLNAVRSDKDEDKQMATTDHGVYENSPSSYLAAATGEDLGDVYSMITCAERTSETAGDQGDPGKSDSTNIIQRITVDNPIYHQYSSCLTTDIMES
ncbi:Fc receptor-like protein 1 [Dendropsophus ebraccatus]|uniref:Fc receptor-like protein 1 n=1 Tax=Dendropsophus ebraccatus TaxID=150705 RepID=UPI0038315BBF